MRYKTKSIWLPWVSFAAVLLWVIGLAPLRAGAEEPKNTRTIDFQRDVRPILFGHCIQCHGPDGNARKSNLRLDIREGAIGPAKSGRAAIVPGAAEKSGLVQRIFSSDESEVMPPPETKHPLSAKQKEVLKRWIIEGAEYTDHWAFVPPQQPEPPPVKLTSWPRNPIDRFILARLEQENLTPSRRANPHELIRRVYLDLIGLPPTPEEADAFARDPSPMAYERVVDDLLASPHYGERWARLWLDLARYADTNGYEKDRHRSIWPYRDWVIRAINSDMPFDQFTVEQIAGDMLPNATLEQRIATGFHRNTMLNEEGGIDPLEFRFYAMVDRVNTTATTWLGLTMACAQCHTHKYDPIPHESYYQFMAFMNNADEPEIELPSSEIAAQRKRIEQKIAALKADLPNRWPMDETNEAGLREQVEEKFATWLEQQRERAVQWELIRPKKATSNLPLLTIEEDGSIFASGDQTKSDTYELTFEGDLAGITAIRIEALPDDRLPRRGPGRVYYEGPIGDFTLTEITAIANGKSHRFDKASHTFANGAFTAEAAIDGNPQTGWSVDGGQGKAHLAVFNFSSPLAEAPQLTLRLLFERHFSAGLGRFKVWATKSTKSAQALPISRELESLLFQNTEELSQKNRQLIFEQFLAVTPELAEARKEIAELEKQLPSFPTTLVMAERPPANPRRTFVHHRGEFLQPSAEVEPDIPSILHPFPKDGPRNRLTFARWLVDRRNPLVGRVVMNRHWTAFFGTGIVRTVQDFGFQGELPSHPELLDWLAVEWINQNWSIKKMHRLIVTSATYQQSSSFNAPFEGFSTPDTTFAISRAAAEHRTPRAVGNRAAELLERDPDNRLLARGPRVRLEAELIRDVALRASGLLSPKIGGPSVFPPQPPGVTTEGTYGALEWKVSEGEDRYRRGLYTFSKRTAPYAMFTTFDASSGEACVALREVSNTPLQALTLLNDTVFVEAAQALGRLAAERPGTSRDRAGFLFRRCLTRAPDMEELTMALEFYQKQKQRIDSKQLDAALLAGPGSEDNVIERAAWTALARALLNLDSAIH